MSNYMTGEPMVPPSEREIIKSNSGPVDWSIRSKCEKMENEQLEAVIREASRILNERKNARARKLIEKVYVALNELKEMGNVEFNVNCDYECNHNILNEVDHFDASMFNIRG